MAGMKSIDAALVPLEEMIAELATIVRLVDEAAGDRPPLWLQAMFSRVIELEKAIDVYAMAVHQHARPVLGDMASLSRN